MPIITKKIQGTEYRFASLKLKEVRALQVLKSGDNVIERFDEWKPFLTESLKRGGSQLPDLEEMDVQEAGVVFAELIHGVMEASGMPLVETNSR